MVEKATGGNSASNQSQDEGNASENSVTMEQVVQVVNSAITARNRAFEAKLESQFSELKSMLSPKTDEQPEATSKGSKKVSPEVEALQNQLKMLQGDRAKARDMQLRTTVKEQLMKAGVNPAHVKALVALHVDADKTITYADDNSDEILFKGADSHYTLEQGLGTWLKSEDAKPYLPAKGASGSGDKSYHNNTLSGKNVKPSRSEVGNFIHQALTGLPSSDEE